jgi:hypothetical protein
MNERNNERKTYSCVVSRYLRNIIINIINFEVRHPRCVLNHNVENECEKSVTNTTILGIFIASDGGYLATTTCFGHHGGHRQVVHATVGKLIQHAIQFVQSISTLLLL